MGAVANHNILHLCDLSITIIIIIIIILLNLFSGILDR